MKNLVIKTVVITLAAIVSLMAITFGALTVFTPKTLGGVFDGAGNYSAAVFFYDLQYEKTGDIEDLAVLIDESYGFGDKENAKKYALRWQDVIPRNFAASPGGLTQEEAAGILSLI